MTTDPTTPASEDEPAMSDERHGELDPRMAYETAQRMLRYVDAFNGEEWALSTLGGNVDRKNLGVALDNLQECAAMLLNQSDRLRAVIAADRAARQAPASPLQQAQDGERLDAARYRWLRSGKYVRQEKELRDRGGRRIDKSIFTTLMSFNFWCAPHELDAAIDAAIQSDAARKEGEKG